MQKKKSNTFLHNFKFDALQTIYIVHTNTQIILVALFSKIHKK